MGNTIAQPDTTFIVTSATQPVQNAAQKVLLVGQITSAGSAADGSWHQNISSGDENALFGQSSQLANMVRAFKDITDRVQVDAIALDDNGSGAARVVDVPISGAATEAGTLYITAGSEKRFRFAVGVISGDSAATVCATAVAAINADAACPYTASVGSTPDRVVLTSDNDGTVANNDPIEIEGSVAGLTLGTVANATTGATDPTLTGILDVIGNTRYQGIVWPYGTTPAVANALLAARLNPSNAVLDGVAITAVSASLASHLSTLSGADFNHPHLVYLADELQTESQYLGPAVAEASYIKATYFAAIRALRMTPDVPISRYVNTNAALDQIGGPGGASLPYFNTPIPQLPVPRNGRGFTSSETEQLLAAGAGIIGQNAAGSAAIAGEIPTTYLTDAAGNPDVTFKYLNYFDTISQAREYFANNVRSRFSQSRLTTGTVTAGRSMANAGVIKGFLVNLYNDLAGPAYTLVVDGDAAVKFFKDNISIAIDMAQGKATISMKLPIVTQLRTILATVEIAFSVEQ